ncbi:MAG: type II CAAX endopeptidase family protein [Pseudomonadota bacterium]
MKDRALAPLEAAGIITLCFGWFMLGSILSVLAGFQSDGGAFTDASLISLVLTELVVGAAALLILHRRGHTLTDLLPRPDWRGCFIGAMLYLLTAGFGALIFAGFGGGDEQAIAQMMAGSKPSLLTILVLALVNGSYEEVFLLGYLARGFSHLGHSFALGLSVLVRLVYHLYQGPLGALWVTVFGIVVGLYYLRTRRLWPVVFAHMLGDVIPFL